MSKPEDKTAATQAETPDSLLNVGAGPAAELTEGQLDDVSGAAPALKAPYKLKINDGG
jgi:hypothetical protein